MKILYGKSNKNIYWSVEGETGYYKKSGIFGGIISCEGLPPISLDKLVIVNDGLLENNIDIYIKIAGAIQADGRKKEQQLIKSALKGNASVKHTLMAINNLKAEANKCFSNDPNSQHGKIWKEIEELLNSDNALTTLLKQKIGSYKTKLEFKNGGQCIIKGNITVAVKKHSFLKSLDWVLS